MDGERLQVDVAPAGAEVQIARAVGALSLATVAALRTGADKALAAQPDLLVIDLSRVVLRDRLAARVLPLIAADASVWPVTRVAIAGATADLEGALRRTGLSTLTWFPDVASAAYAASRRPVSARVALPREAAAASMARRVVHALSPERIRERAEIVVTELVGNAVQHTRGRIELRVVRGRRVHISVRDGMPNLPDTDDGYGLDVVRRFAIAWGWRPVSDGKVVWAVVGPAPRRRSVRVTCAR
jgi:hypothetical protein